MPGHFTRRRYPRRRLLQVEALERRDLLNAAPLGADDQYTLLQDRPLILQATVSAATTSSDLNSLQEVNAFAVNDELRKIVYSPAYQLLASLVVGKKVIIFDPDTGDEISSNTAINTFSDLDFTPDGRYLYVADFGGQDDYGTPIKPSYVHRFDLSTRTWQSKIIGGAGYQVEAVDATRFLLKTYDQHTDITLRDFGSTPADPVTQLAVFHSTYRGDFEYDNTTGYIYHGSDGISTEEIKVARLVGNTMQGVKSIRVNGGPESTLSMDGTRYYFGTYQLLTSDNSFSFSFGESIYAGAGNIAFGNNSFWNTLTGTKLGDYALPFETVAVSSDQKWFWGFDQQTMTLHQYRVPGGWYNVLANDTDPDGDALTAAVASLPAHGSVTLQANGFFTYTPAPGYSGPDQFTYRAFDGTNYSEPITVNLTIWPFLANPSGVANYNATEDQPLAVATAQGLLRGALAADSSPLTVRLVSGAAHGQVTLQADGSFQYVPAADYFGFDEFTYRVIGSSEVSPIGTVRLYVTGVEDAPRPQDDVYTIFEDQTINIDWRVNQSTTAANFSGLQQVQSFTYSDSSLLQIKYSSAYNILALRTAQNITLINAGNTNIISTLTTGETFSDMDFSSDGRYLFVADFGGETNGLPTRPNIVRRYDIVTGTWESKTAPGVAYRIEAIDGEKFLLLDKSAKVDLTLNSFGATPATAIMELNRVTQPLMFQGDMEFSALTNQVYYAASNTYDGAAYWFRLVNDQLFLDSTMDLPLNSGSGVAFLSDEARYIYTARNQYDIDNEVLSSTFPADVAATLRNLVISGGNIYNAATALLLGAMPNNPKILGTDDAGTMLWAYSGSGKQITGYFVPGSFEHPLVNDSEPDGDPLVFSLLTGTSHGTLTQQANGSFKYVPPAGFSGTDTFTYKVTDPAGNSSTATATIHVKAVDDAPIANAESYNTIEETTLTIGAAQGLLINDSDPEGAALSISGFTQPANGTVTVAADGSFVYTPKANFYGVDTFTYKVSDGTAYSYANASITVANTQDPPIANPDTYSGSEDNVISAFASNNVLKNDVDYDNNPLTAELITPPVNGTFSFQSDGRFTYRPPADFFGTVSFTYRAFDGIEYSNVTTATIEVRAVNDAPIGVADLYTLPLGANSLTVTAAAGVLANDTDVDNPVLTSTILASPQYGSVVLNADGSFTYTKNANFVLSDSFTYRARDGVTTSSSTTVTIELATGRIVVGAHTLLANTPNQQIALYMTGSVSLNGMNLRLQVGDGANGSIEPIITAVDYENTIWSGAPRQITGGPVSGTPQLVDSRVNFDAPGNSVIGNGKIVTLTVDTTGIYSGNFALSLKNTQLGADTDTLLPGSSVPIPLFLTNGTISVAAATVISRKTFYNNSYFDGYDPTITPADLSMALATGKTALRPEQTATFTNYTSYSKGINGIVIEVVNVAYQPQLDEFEFRTGNTTTPDSWALLNVAPTMTVETVSANRVRIYFTWPDNTITKQWLQVLVKAKGPMGLPLDDVFYFGNAVGDTGNQTGNAYVDGLDFAYTRDNKHNFLNRAAVTDPADFNRDSLVDATDLGLARDNTTNFISALKLFTPPAHVTPPRTPYVPPSLTLGPAAESQFESAALASSDERLAATQDYAAQTTSAVPAARTSPSPVALAQTAEVSTENADLHALAYAQWLGSSTDEAIDGLLPGVLRKKLLAR